LKGLSCPIRLDCENILGIFDAVNDCLVKFLQEFNEIIELFILKMGFIQANFDLGGHECELIILTILYIDIF